MHISGVSRSNNDLNVLATSPLISNILSGRGDGNSFKVNGFVYDSYYLFGDGSSLLPLGFFCSNHTWTTRWNSPMRLGLEHMQFCSHFYPFPISSFACLIMGGLLLPIVEEVEGGRLTLASWKDSSKISLSINNTDATYLVLQSSVANPSPHSLRMRPNEHDYQVDFFLHLISYNHQITKIHIIM